MSLLPHVPHVMPNGGVCSHTTEMNNTHNNNYTKSFLLLLLLLLHVLLQHVINTTSALPFNNMSTITSCPSCDAQWRGVSSYPHNNNYTKSFLLLLLLLLTITTLNLHTSSTTDTLALAQQHVHTSCPLRDAKWRGVSSYY